MRIVARRREGFAHEIEVDGHAVRVDEPAEQGGTDTVMPPKSTFFFPKVMTGFAFNPVR